MSDRQASFRDFFSELRRRKVYQVTAVYLVAAIAGLEVVSVVVPSTSLPDWSDELFLALAMLGLPLAMVLAWALEVTPDGVRWTSPRGNEPDSAVAAVTRPGSDDRGVETAGVRDPGVGTAADPSTEPELDERAVAVLPFENLSDSAEAEPFVAGLHDDVLTELSKIPGLIVISRTSVKRYKGSDKTIPEIGRELGAGTVVEGGVQEAAGRVRLNVQLIDARNDVHRWAERYDRELTTETIFEIQSELAERIAVTLRAELTSPAGIADRPATEDLEAYRLRAWGKQIFGVYTAEGLSRAAELFQAAIDRDPSYAAAWAGLANALILLGDYGHVEPEAVLRRGESAARKALELDPSLPEALTSLGNLHSARRQGPEARRLHRRAIELQPSYADAHKWLGWTSLLIGEPRPALEAASRACRLDPLDAEARGNLAMAKIGCGDVEGGLAEARRALERLPDFDWARWVAGVALHGLGRADEAEQKLVGVSEAWASPWQATVHALRAAAAGAVHEARASADGVDLPFHRGVLHAALGDLDVAFGELAAASPWSWEENLYLRYGPSEPMDRLRGDPRFESLISELDRSWGVESR